MTGTRRTAAAAAGASLVAGCGGSGTEPSGSASTAAASPAAFRQKAVRADLDAVAAAGLPRGRTETGYFGSGLSAGAASGAEREKPAALVTRLSPCVVPWATDGTADSARLDGVLAGLERRGWEKACFGRLTDEETALVEAL